MKWCFYKKKETLGKHDLLVLNYVSFIVLLVHVLYLHTLKKTLCGMSGVVMYLTIKKQFNKASNESAKTCLGPLLVPCFKN